MIFQHFNLLWSRTVRENIAYPLEIADHPKSERLTRVVDLLKNKLFHDQISDVYFYAYNVKWLNKFF